ncbi:hypothetical protein T492DRAFT_1087950 [Pavlovales sp. CCMP2436]|nr:hypothetical protein T492DRAFT_1087950 [Pavlovales sp. CCMP2436]
MEPSPLPLLRRQDVSLLTPPGESEQSRTAVSPSAHDAVPAPTAARERLERLLRRLLVDASQWAAVFAAVVAVVGTDAGEDVVDLCHSVWASRESLRIASTLSPSRRHDVIMPQYMATLAHNLFATSLAYFWSDIAFITLQRARGRSPHLWAGRLIHHIIQTVANGPVLLIGPGRAQRVMSAYLGLAYTAEISTICLRISRLLARLQRLRRAKSGGWLLELLGRANHRVLLVTFALFRLVNFPLCGRLIRRNRAELPPHVADMHIGFASVGYLINVGWFIKLARGSGGSRNN